jgi:hypothetical protein
VRLVVSSMGATSLSDEGDDMSAVHTAGREVRDHAGVRIGVATDGGDVYDDSRVRIGTVTSTGDAYDHRGVRIGKVHLAR